MRNQLASCFFYLVCLKYFNFCCICGGEVPGAHDKEVYRAAEVNHRVAE